VQTPRSHVVSGRFVERTHNSADLLLGLLLGLLQHFANVLLRGDPEILMQIGDGVFVCPQDRGVSSGGERGIFLRHDILIEFRVWLSSRRIAWL
jgi:hypothetical protein